MFKIYPFFRRYKDSTKKYVYWFLFAFIFILGIFLRFKAFLLNFPLWLDECSLSLSIIDRGIFGYFAKLEHIQSAPPLFMMITKVHTMLFNINGYSLRFISFISSILSFILFYIFVNKILSKKYTILISLFLFAVNYQLIYYTIEFKQYSSDVFICLLMFILYFRLEIEKLNKTKIFLLGAASFFAFLVSIPSIFITGAFVLYNLVKKNIEILKKLLYFFITYFVLMPFYYFYTLAPSRDSKLIPDFWDFFQSGFLTLNPLSFMNMLKENLIFIFEQKNFVLFGAILFILGLIILFKNIKSKNLKARKLSLMILFVFLCAIIASLLMFYPIKERIALYLVPFFIVLILKPLDMANFTENKSKSAAAGLLLCLFISVYFQPVYYHNIYKRIEIKKGTGGKLMSVLKQNYKESEIVVYNDASRSIYKYYSLSQNFRTDKYIMINTIEYDKEYYINLLNMLPKNNTYWFYYPYDYHKKPVIPFVEEWAKDKDILDVIKTDTSYLLHVRV